jgi:ubiquinone/menaquinone biosynthesis C-methylase UbiE
MSTYVFMRILESAPDRYDLGMRLLTLGRLERAYQRLLERIGSGQDVLDIGCGTGALTIGAARRGARVTGIDIDAAMLEIARDRVREGGLGGSVQLIEMGIAELDGQASSAYDVVTSGLCLSELSEDEVAFALGQIRRILRPGGLLLVADEIRPGSWTRRLISGLIRFPLLVLTWLATQQTTHRIAHLASRLEEAGLRIVSIRRSFLGSFGEFVAMKPGSADA